MTQCIGVKPNGELCRCVAARGSDFCPAHDPARKEARHRNASKAARSKPGREIKDLKVQLESLANDVLNESVEPKVGVVVNQILNSRLRAVELERKIREQDELERRLEVMAEVLERQKGGSAYGAAG